MDNTDAKSISSATSTTLPSPDSGFSEPEELTFEEEMARLERLQTQLSEAMPWAKNDAGRKILSKQEQAEADSRSIYVGNVDYGGTVKTLEAHFESVGEVKRVTIPINKFNGQPKGFAYVEFASESSVDASLALNGSVFRGREIQILPKRTNVPGYGKRGGFFQSSSRGAVPQSTGFRGRGRGQARGRGGFQGAFPVPGNPRFNGTYRGRGGASRFRPY